jgi:hypothetical protein
MRTRGVRGLPAIVLLIALGCICSSAPLYAKKLPKRLPHLQPLAHLIKCADVFDGQPCWPDPNGAVGFTHKVFGSAA